MHELTSMVFTIAITFHFGPITRNNPNPWSDWAMLIMSVALFVKQAHFVLLLGVGPYLYDSFNIAEILSSIATVGALFLGVCNEGDWPVEVGSNSSSILSFAFAFER